MEQISIRVTNEIGLHARPAAQVVGEASRFQADIRIRNRTTNSQWVSAKSILGVLGLGVEKDHEIEVSASGADEEHALATLNRLILGFGERNGNG